MDHPCFTNFDTDVSNFDPNWPIMENLDEDKFRLLNKLALVLNTTLTQLFRMVFVADGTKENSTHCIQILLEIANDYLIPNDVPANEFIYMRNLEQPYVTLGLICSILMIAVAVFGIVGNAVSVWFFGRLSTKSSINTMLTAMSAFDCILLLTGAPLYSAIGLHSYTENNNILKSMSCCLIYFYTVSIMSQTATTWMLVLITFERYVAVCRPFMAKRYCTLGRARKAVLAVSAFAIGYNIIRFWEFESDSDTGAPKPMLRNQPYYRTIYMNWMYLTIVFLIPFTIIAFFNTLIIRTIHAARIERRAGRFHSGRRCLRSNSSSSRILSEHRTAAMLLVVVLVFMLCEILAPVLNAWEIIGRHDDSAAFHFLSDLNNLLIMLHSTMNVGIYIGFCSEFRRVCRLLVPFAKRVFCCRHAKEIAYSNGSNFDVSRGSQRKRIGSTNIGNDVSISISRSAEQCRLTKIESSPNVIKCSNRFLMIPRTGSMPNGDESTCV